MSAQWRIEDRNGRGDLYLARDAYTPRVVVFADLMTTPEAIERLAERVVAALNDLDVHVDDVATPYRPAPAAEEGPAVRSES